MATFAEKKRQIMQLNMIVAASPDGAIGRGGDLIWRIPADLRRFKALTMGHPIIMGRKTWESLPKRPLPGRVNIVVTRTPGYVAEGAVVVNSTEEALATAASLSNATEESSENSPFVIGGAEIYNAFMPEVTRIYLTEVADSCPDADARLSLSPDSSGWKREEESDWAATDAGVRYRYVTLARIS